MKRDERSDPASSVRDAGQVADIPVAAGSVRWERPTARSFWNALADWRQQAAARQGSYPGYHLILLREVRYTQAEKAADWEFTYDRNGVMVQVLNRNILANARHAYALYWSTPVSDWNAYYHFFQVFAATFRPAPPG